MPNTSRTNQLRRALRRANWANILAVLALLVSVVTAAYDIWSDRQRATEQMHVSGVPVHSDYPTFLERRADAGLIETVWQVDISNFGDRPFAISSYEIQSSGIRFGPLQRASGYSGLDRGLFNLEFEALKLPIVVEPGYSSRLYVKIGSAVHPEAWKCIEAKFGEGHQSSMNAIQRELHRCGTDLYGNSALFQELGGGEGEYVATFSTPLDAPLFNLSFATARGTHQSVTVSWYHRTE